MADILHLFYWGGGGGGGGGLLSAVGNVSECRYVSGCRSRGHKFNPGPVPYFRVD